MTMTTTVLTTNAHFSTHGTWCIKGSHDCSNENGFQKSTLAMQKNCKLVGRFSQCVFILVGQAGRLAGWQTDTPHNVNRHLFKEDMLIFAINFNFYSLHGLDDTVSLLIEIGILSKNVAHCFFVFFCFVY